MAFVGVHDRRDEMDFACIGCFFCARVLACIMINSALFGRSSIDIGGDMKLRLCQIKFQIYLMCCIDHSIKISEFLPLSDHLSK